MLFYRFEPSVAIDTIRDERPTFTIASITVFIALMNAPNAERDALASLTKTWSGGAPIPPSAVKAFQAQFGHYIHNAYGLTETTSPRTPCPSGADAPVDEASGALSVGVPIYNTVVRIVGDDGQDLPPGEVGEIVTSGPWWCPATGTSPRRPSTRCPAARCTPAMSATWTPTAGSTSSTGRRTRSTRAATRLAARGRGRPLPARGGARGRRGRRARRLPRRDGQGVRQPAPRQDRHGRGTRSRSRQDMAAYKYPRQIEFLDELPKTVTGKLLRRELRDRDRAT